MNQALRRLPLLILLVLALVGGGCAASEAQKAAAEGARLYDLGDYDGALPLLEKAAAKGASDGQLHYQLAYIYDLKGQPERARSSREKAQPLLARLAGSAKGTVEDSYYLTALYASLQRTADMRKSAEEGVKKFGQRTDLSGEDLFRLGRLYQFAGSGELATASYRKAAEAMAGEKDPNPILFSLALASDAGSDFQARRYAEAARKLEKAGSLNPKNPPPVYQVALAELGAGSYAQARERFAAVRDEATATEAQYGVDVAAHLERCGGRTEKMPDGKPLLDMDNNALQESLNDAARSYREAKGAGKGDDPAGPREAERLFFSLAAEWMLRGNSLRETSLSGNYADLIRR